MEYCLLLFQKVDSRWYTLERITLRLNQIDRERESRENRPSLLYFDSQSVKLNPILEK